MSKFIIETDSNTTVHLGSFYKKPGKKFSIRIEDGSGVIFLFVTRKDNKVEIPTSEYKEKLAMLCKREENGVHSPERYKLQEMVIDLTTEQGYSEARSLFAAFAGLMIKKTKTYKYGHGGQVLLGCFKDNADTIWIVGAFYNSAAKAWLFSTSDAAEYWTSKEHTEKPNHAVPQL